MIIQQTRPLPDLLADLRSGTLPLLQYLDDLESRFEQYEAQVLAFVPEPERFSRLRYEARKLLALYPDPDDRPQLFGLPIGVKDIFQVAGFTTRAGSSLPEEKLQGQEAASVSTLRAAGALIMGKTVTTEFAYFAPGPTRNPRALEHTPGGSSSGSAAAVAAGLCPLALGTQTIGSVNRPAAFCGVVGYKPSYGRISKEGVIPLSPSADHVGLFVQQVTDVSPVAALLCQDWQTVDLQVKPVLGIPDGPYLTHASTEGQAHFQAGCTRLIEAGYKLKRVAALMDFEEIFQAHNLIVAAEAAKVHAIWYAEYRSLYHAKTAELIERGKGFSPVELTVARRSQEVLRQELLHLMDENGLDLWLSPAAVGAAPKGLDSTGDPVMNLPWTHAGVPTLTVPSGNNEEGLPFGLQLAARWHEDERLLGWAEQIENTFVALPG